MCAFYIEAKTKTHRIAYLEYGFYIKCNFLIGVRFFFMKKKINNFKNALGWLQKTYLGSFKNWVVTEKVRPQ